MKSTLTSVLATLSHLRTAGLLTLALTSLAVAADAPPSASPTTLTQSPPVAQLSTQPDGTRYKGDSYAGMENRIAKLKGPCEVIFIGDSITQGWKGAVWEKYYAGRHALNYGVAGDSTQNVLYRLNCDGLKTLKPKVAVILIGTNNTGHYSPGEIAAGVKAVIDKTLALFPASKIILLDILPTARKTQTAVAANELIAKLSDEKTVFRLNLGEQMVKEGDTWKGLGKDRLHLTEEGYLIWAEAMEPLLARLLGETKTGAKIRAP